MRLRIRCWAALLLLLAFGCRGVAPVAAPIESSSATSPAKTPSPTPKSVAAAPAVSSQPAPQPQLDDFGGLGRPQRIPAVEREEAHLEEAYAEVPLLQSLPDFLSLEAVARALPADWQEVRGWLQEWRAADTASELLRGGYLDSQERYYLVWLHRNLDQLALVFDRQGRRKHQQVFSRARPTFREVLALETPAERDRGATARELVVFRITTMSLCCLPTDLDVYALLPTGRLRLILSLPKDHVQVGPGVRYEFLNHVEFLDRRAVVTQLVPESPLRWEFEYQNARGRFEPNAATVQSIEEERLRLKPK